MTWAPGTVWLLVMIAPPVVVLAVWIVRRVLGARMGRRQVHRAGPAADAWPDRR